MTRGAFTSNYERWVLGRRRGKTVQAELSRTYRDAWRNGDEHDRYLALNFIFETRDSSGFELVIDGLHSHEAGLAQHAAIMASVLVGKGALQLTPAVRRAFAKYNRRFPERSFPEHG